MRRHTLPLVSRHFERVCLEQCRLLFGSVTMNCSQIIQVCPLATALSRETIKANENNETSHTQHQQLCLTMLTSTRECFRTFKQARTRRFGARAGW